MSDTLALLTTRLQTLAPTSLEIIDESHLHAGHAGNTGGGHYRVLLVSAAFEGLSAIARHQMVYATVQDLIPHTVHALSLTLKTPTESPVSA